MLFFFLVCGQYLVAFPCSHPGQKHSSSVERAETGEDGTMPDHVNYSNSVITAVTIVCSPFIVPLKKTACSASEDL